jgi:hypothetical protein
MTEASKTLYGDVLSILRSNRMPERKSAIEILLAIFQRRDEDEARKNNTGIMTAVGRQSLWLFGSIRTRLTPICCDRES